MARKKKQGTSAHSVNVLSTTKQGKNVPHAHAKKAILIPAWMIPTILVVTAFVFMMTLKADFVNLDDSDYVTNNALVKAGPLKDLLLSTVQGNFHPLTMLSLYVNYAISGDSAWSYHLFNLLLHLANCFLVFRLVILLSNKNAIIAFTTALFFGIHPMHVESVAWVSERKDVLYGCFFLLGLISYTKYIDGNSRKQYVFAILFLFLSLLSKPAAVIFPVTLLCIDLLRKRLFNAKLITEKIPFFVLALIGGIITITGQKAAGATGQELFSLGSKILFGFYGIMMYAVKLVLPFNLAAFYGYPAINRPFSFEYYVAPLFFIVLAVLFYYSMKRNRVIAFGLLFYLVNLLLVLQFLPVGSAVIAERYTYIPYIGLFFIAGWLIEKYAKGNASKSYRIILPLGLIFSILSWKQVSVWQDGKSLWDHAIKTQPSNKAYANRATLLRSEKKYDSAIKYFNKALELSTIDHESYNNRGNVYFDLNKPELAIRDYRKALSIKPDYYPAMDNMAAQLATLGLYDSALRYENVALSLKPDYKVAYGNRALVFMKLNRYTDAIKDWQKFLEFEPDAADVHNTLGFCYQSIGNYQQAILSINTAISINAQPIFYLNRAYAYNALRNTEAAKNDVYTAKKGGVKIPDDLLRSLGIQ